MQSRLGEVARRLRSALTVDDVVTAHALGGKLSLQSPRMHRELVGDGLGAALAGGQQPPGQFGHAFGQRGTAGQVGGFQVLRRDASGLGIGGVDGLVGNMRGSSNPHQV